ncbi:MAG TPA: amidohydrolase [Steroidobacteraceae bacterium]|nr:amidohydrolase [Steroidobacteraceae bacterium]
MRTDLVAMALVVWVGFPVLVAAGTPSADVVLLDGRIHTQDSNRRVVQAMALRGNTIIAVGTDQVVSALKGPKTKTVDLAGRTVLPGIIDAHTHPASSAGDIDLCSLEDKIVTPDEVKARLIECLHKHPVEGNRWFEVVAVNPTHLSLTLADLDAITHKPMVLFGADGHTVWLNSAALQASQITAATKDPANGRIERDTAGNPTGTLRDGAADIAGFMPRPTIEYESAELEKAFDAMHAVGITSVQDASVGDHAMEIYKRLYDSHRLTMRVRASYLLEDLHEPAATLIERAVAFRKQWAINPEFLRADAVKLFADGVIEYPTQSAALLAPYLDANGHPTDNRGPTYFTQENLDRIVSGADAAGLTVHIHAIGDRAIRASLDAFAAARRRNGRLDNRDQIAHVELIDPADIPRFKELDVIANMQLLWARRAIYVSIGTLPYLGPDRSRYLYAARSLRDAGAMIVGGSDWDVSTFNPFEAMEHAVTRAKGRGEEPLYLEQGIRLQEIVDAYTINAAYALKQERTTGSLEPGKRGDFIVLDRDIFTIEPFDLHETKVLSTYLDGREVYAAIAK